MKLYFSPGACSLSTRIALLEAGLPFEAVQASTKTHQLLDGTDYYTINAKGYVPLLELDDGTRLTEVPVLLQYIADQVPGKQLAPPAGTMERYREQEWLNFITSELHKGIGGLFNPAMPEEAKALMRQKALTRLTWVDGQLAGKDYTMGDTFTVADAYLFVMGTWAAMHKLDVSGLANFGAFMARVKARPAVQQALQAEGLAA